MEYQEIEEFLLQAQNEIDACFGCIPCQVQSERNSRPATLELFCKNHLQSSGSTKDGFNKDSASYLRNHTEFNGFHSSLSSRRRSCSMDSLSSLLTTTTSGTDADSLKHALQAVQSPPYGTDLGRELDQILWDLEASRRLLVSPVSSPSKMSLLSQMSPLSSQLAQMEDASSYKESSLSSSANSPELSPVGALQCRLEMDDSLTELDFEKTLNDLLTIGNGLDVASDSAAGGVSPNPLMKLPNGKVMNDSGIVLESGDGTRRGSSASSAASSSGSDCSLIVSHSERQSEEMLVVAATSSDRQCAVAMPDGVDSLLTVSVKSAARERAVIDELEMILIHLKEDVFHLEMSCCKDHHHRHPDDAHQRDEQQQQQQQQQRQQLHEQMAQAAQTSATDGDETRPTSASHLESDPDSASERHSPSAMNKTDVQVQVNRLSPLRNESDDHARVQLELPDKTEAINHQAVICNGSVAVAAMLTTDCNKNEITVTMDAETEYAKRLAESRQTGEVSITQLYRAGSNCQLRRTKPGRGSQSPPSNPKSSSEDGSMRSASRSPSMPQHHQHSPQLVEGGSMMQSPLLSRKTDDAASAFERQCVTPADAQQTPKVSLLDSMYRKFYGDKGPPPPSPLLARANASEQQYLVLRGRPRSRVQFQDDIAVADPRESPAAAMERRSRSLEAGRVGPNAIARRIFRRQAASQKRTDDDEHDVTKVHPLLSRLVDLEKAEIDAVEACRWLRAAGFPQYAQMFEDLRFPIDIDSVEKDHDFLDRDSIQSLFRRLEVLNRCAAMKLDTVAKKVTHDSDDDEPQCALSDRWRFQRSSGRWSRRANHNDSANETQPCDSSHDSLLTDSSSPPEESPPAAARVNAPALTVTDTTQASPRPSPLSTPKSGKPLQRTASERLKGARGFLKKMESLRVSRKSKNGKKQLSSQSFSGDAPVKISGPVLVETPELKEKMAYLGCVDIPSPSSESTSPDMASISSNSRSGGALRPQAAGPGFSDSSSLTSSPEVSLQRRRTPESGCLSSKSSVCSAESPRLPDTALHSSDRLNNNSLRKNVSNEEVSTPSGRSKEPAPVQAEAEAEASVPFTGTYPKMLSNGYIRTAAGNSLNYRTGSFNLGRESQKHPNVYPGHRRISDEETARYSAHTAQQRKSIYDNVSSPLSSPRKNSTTANTEPVNTEGASLQEELTQLTPDGESSALENSDDTQSSRDECGKKRERRDSGVGSSLTRAPSYARRQRIKWHSFNKSHRPNSRQIHLQITTMSAEQLMVLRKFSLLRLTAMMEKYSPSHKSGWHWAMPKLMRRNKTPDYRDKHVFGVPLSVSQQRTGQPLPQAILQAMRFLRRSAAESIGIFRKSGVRSRIQKLRESIEANPNTEIDFDGIQAYDVADMLKQYFRELPECLLTTKLSETFLQIHNYCPIEQRVEAMQHAVLLLPDENREVLQCLLLFLSDITQHSDENQMTASNLAVCFAPTLFNLNGIRSKSDSSPRRPRKTTPDQRDLQEQRAAHECLTKMIQQVNDLFMVAEETMAKCRFSMIEENAPCSIQELCNGEGSQALQSYVEACLQSLLKETRDKVKWVSVSNEFDVDLAYKKVGDGHPLRLWKCSADIEAPPTELLNRILRERHEWDEDLASWRIIEQLDRQTEVFQYVVNSMVPHPSRDYCELRSWRTDLPRGGCMLISTSVEHPAANLVGGMRAITLASRYIIQPCGSGKSRVVHVSRADLRGRMPEWYGKSYGLLAVRHLNRLRQSFQQKAAGPETKL